MKIKKAIFEDCVLLIPTKDRTSFLERALHFYAQYEQCPKIVIADSSNEQFLESNKDLINRFSSHLEVEQLVFDEDFPIVDKIIDSVKALDKYKFMAMVADDDFLSLAIGPQCLEFLRKSEKHAFATGISVRIKSNNLNPPNPNKTTFSKTILADSPLERARIYASCKRHKMYGFHNRKLFLESLIDSKLVLRRELDIFTEYFLYLSVILRGKFLCLDEIGIVFIDHDKNVCRNYEQLDLPVHKQDTYEEQINVASEILAKWLAKNDVTHTVESTKPIFEQIVRELFEKKRNSYAQHKRLCKKYFVFRIIFFPVKLVYYLADKLHIRTRAIVNSPDEFFNFRMQASNSSFRAIFQKINKANQ